MEGEKEGGEGQRQRDREREIKREIHEERRRVCDKERARV